MKILDRYLLSEWLKVFAFTMMMTLGILVLHNMYNELGDLLNFGATIPQIFLFYLLIIPSFIPTVLPISLLISIVFVLGSMHRNNEITAMRSIGLNVFRITRALWIVAIFLSVAYFYINAELVPRSVESSRLLFDNLKFTSEQKNDQNKIVGLINNLCFNNRKNSREWFMNKYSQATQKGYGVEVHVLDTQHREISKILAKEGVYDELEKCWFFSNGQQIFFNPESGRPIKASVFQKQYFKDFNEEPNIMRLSMARPKDLSLFELRNLIVASGGYETPSMRPYVVKLSNIWASTFSCLIVVAIAIPFSVSGVRTNPMVGVSKTAALFFIYYVLDSVFSALGSNAIIPIWLASATPVVFMIVFALSLYRKIL